MALTTFFGEVDELNSRAVWYDNEDEEDTNDGLSIDHDALRNSTQVRFTQNASNQEYDFNYCLISLLNSQQLSGFSPRENENITKFGSFGRFGKAFVRTSETGSGQMERCLLLLFDSTYSPMKDHRTAYLVESLIATIRKQVQWTNTNNPIIILDEQFSTSGHLEYLASSCGQPTSALTQTFFHGYPIQAPHLVKNAFIAALFEQLLLARMLTFVVRLPDPRDIWFDKTKDWPTLPERLLRIKLSDCNLERTLLFT